MRERAPLSIAVLVTVALLMAFAPRYLEHWDEIQLELGMRRFDLGWHQPHPPGYVLFELAGKLFGFLRHPGRALTLVAVAAWITIVGRALPRRSPILVLFPLLFVLSPTLLTHGSTGRTYVVESVLWVSVLLLVSREGRWVPLTMGALVGLGGGFRPTVLIWGGFALAMMLWRRRRSLTARDVIEMLGALTAAVLVWTFALGVLCGGLDRYSELSAPLLRDNVFAKSMFARGPSAVLAERLLPMVLSLPQALGPFSVVPIILLVERVRRRSAELKELDPVLFGAAIAFAFYLVMIFDSDGYSLSYVLPILTWTILALSRVRLPRVAAVSIAALLVGWAFVPHGLFKTDGVVASRGRVTALIDTRLAAIDTLPAESTLIVTGVEHLNGWNFRLIMYERPNRAVLQVVPDWFFPHVTPAHPYMLARDLEPQAVGPDGLELSSLPYFDASKPLRHVVYAVPREAPARMDASCLMRVSALPTSRGEALPHLEVGPSLRVFARGGKLFCVGSDLTQPKSGGG